MNSASAHSRPAPPASLWHRSWRHAWFKRAFYELLGALLLGRRGFMVLNCGYQERDYPGIAVPAKCEDDRPGFQLYHRLVRDTPLIGRDVVEVGCGRGGGAALLCHEFEPGSYTATDASFLLMAARGRQRHPRLRFRRCRADRLPFSAHSFDVGLTVETVHTLSDKPAFLSAMARILRPDGVLLIADFFYTRESSSHAAALFRGHIERSEFVVAGEEDWTANALAALEEQSPRRLAVIGRLPRWVQPAALSFAGTTQSPLYRQMRDGQAQYLFFRLELRPR